MKKQIRGTIFAVLLLFLGVMLFTENDLTAKTHDTTVNDEISGFSGAFMEAGAHKAINNTVVE